MTSRDQAAPLDIEPVPEPPASAALVALVPASDDLDAAAVAAWEYARRVANGGRRVALIDCYVDAPRLHTVTGESNEDGIVDVFEYGASLSRIARAQPEGTLFFVPAGTFSPHPAGMMASPRWRRLAAGFRHEDAVMLLFLPPDCLGVLACDVDGLVALAPESLDADLGGSPEIRAAVERGIPLLTTFGGTTETAPVVPAPSPVAPPPRHAAPPRTADAEPPRARTPPPAEPTRGRARWPDAPPERPALRRPFESEEPRHRVVWFVLVPLLAVAAAVAVYRLPLGSGGADTAQPSAALPPLPPAYRTLVPHAVDTLSFAVQIAAWTSFPQAVEDADTIEGRGFLPMIAPVRVRRTLWYRVDVGPVASQGAADSLLGVVRRSGLDGSGSATVVQVPLSFALKRVATPLAARLERARLRSAGVAAFVLGQADGSYRLFAGAFDQPAAAAYLDSLLTSTGNAGPLGPRVGFRP